MPCVPGFTPVVSVAKLVAVVDGKVVRTAPWRISEEIVGIKLAYFSTALAPKPSMRNSSSHPLGLSPQLI